jgi:hypothetical protein
MFILKVKNKARSRALVEAEIRGITVQSQPKKIVSKTLSQKNPSQKRAGGVAQGVGSEFKPQYHTKKRIRLDNKQAVLAFLG